MSNCVPEGDCKSSVCVCVCNPLVCITDRESKGELARKIDRSINLNHVNL